MNNFNFNLTFEFKSIVNEIRNSLTSTKIKELNDNLRNLNHFLQEAQQYQEKTAQPNFENAFNLARDVFIFLRKNKVIIDSSTHKEKISFIQKTIEEIKNTPFNAKTFAANPKNRKHVENLKTTLNSFDDLSKIWNVNLRLKTSVANIDTVITAWNSSFSNHKKNHSFGPEYQDIPDHYSLFFDTACNLLLAVDKCIRKLQQEIKEKEDELKRLKLKRKRWWILIIFVLLVFVLIYFPSLFHELYEFLKGSYRKK